MVSYIQCIILIYIIIGTYSQNDISFDVITNILQWTYESHNSRCDYFHVKRSIYSTELIDKINQDYVDSQDITFNARKHHKTRVNWTHFHSTTYSVTIEACTNENDISSENCEFPSEFKYDTDPRKPLVQFPTLEKCENTSCYIKILRIMNGNINTRLIIDVNFKTGIQSKEGNVFNCDGELLKNKSKSISINGTVLLNSIHNISVNIGDIKSRIKAPTINKVSSLCDYEVNIIAVNYYRDKIKCSDSQSITQTCDRASSYPVSSTHCSYLVHFLMALVGLFMAIGYIVLKYFWTWINIKGYDKVNLEDPTSNHRETPIIENTISKEQLNLMLSKCKDTDISDDIRREYELVPLHTNEPNYGAQFTAKNRYCYITPYEWNRVKLEVKHKSSDYINASYIMDAYGEKRYIATQNPLEGTVSDFWKMIWQEETYLIVMLTNFVENGLILSSKYWPESGTKTCDQLEIRYIDTWKYVGYTKTMLQIKNKKESRNITHLHFTSWVDKEIPITPHSFHRFLILVQEHVSSGPIVVHCRSGVERSGAFILCSYILHSCATSGKIDFPGSLHNLRKQRPFMIQELLQYKFCYCVVNEYLHDEAALKINVNDFQKKYDIYSSSSSLNEVVDNVNNGIFWVSVLKLARERAIKETTFRGLYTRENLVSIPNYRNSMNFICLVQPSLEMTNDFWEIVSSKNANVIVSMHSSLNSFEFGLSSESKLQISRDKDVILQDEEDRGTHKISKIEIISNSNHTTKHMVLIQYKTKDKNLFAEPTKFLKFLNDTNLVRKSLTNVILAYEKSFDECVMFLIIQRIVDIMENENIIDISGAIKSVQMYKDFNVSEADIKYICEFIYRFLQHNPEKKRVNNY